jgi:hypothetical protein
MKKKVGQRENVLHFWTTKLTRRQNILGKARVKIKGHVFFAPSLEGGAKKLLI